MENPLASRSGQRMKNVLAQLAVPLLFFLIMALLFPYLACFEFDKDEGVNLMKAMLVARGYPLYESVWSDQPPLLTLLLSAVFRVFGYEVSVARLMVLAFSAALLGAAWRYLRVAGGKVCATLGVILIVWLPYYLRLSLSVMVGLPSLALAMVALAALTEWHQHHRRVWLVLSAVALSFSVLTKVYTGFLVPIFLVGILVDSGFSTVGGKRKLRLEPAIIWCLSLGVITVGALILQPGVLGDLSPLWASHWAARDAEAFGGLTFWAVARDVRAILCLGCLGTLILLWRRRWLWLYPAAWVVCASLLLSQHTPVWYHHQILVSVPAAMLAAGATREIWLWARQHKGERGSAWRSMAVVGMSAALSLTLVSQTPKATELFRDLHVPAYSPYAVASREDLLVAEMASYALKTNWVLTDRPMYAFRSGLTVPPEVAVITAKRLATGGLTEADLLAAIDAYQPELILLTRFKWPTLAESLAPNYHLAYSCSGKNLLLRNDLN